MSGYSNKDILQVMAPRTHSELARWISTGRTSRNLSIRELGRRSGVTHTAIANAEKGMGLSVGACKKLARFFGVSQEFVLRLAGHLDKIEDPKTVMSNTIAEATVRLTRDNQERVLAIIHALQSQQDEEEQRKDESDTQRLKRTPRAS